MERSQASSQVPDYVLPGELVDELAQLRPEADVNGCWIDFRYCIWRRPLRGPLYAPALVLNRKAKARDVQEGHTQRV
jgi:hypothetical protein